MPKIKNAGIRVEMDLSEILELLTFYAQQDSWQFMEEFNEIFGKNLPVKADYELVEDSANGQIQIIFPASEED